MIGFDEAWDIVAAEARPLGGEQVRLEAAHRRILAEPVVAQVDWPPADVSAMDGYAVHSADPSPLRVIGESFAGAADGGLLEPGSCVRIFTGAPVPRGADRVVMQEKVVRDGDQVRFPGPTGGRSHIRMRGSDFRVGQTLLPAGRRLDAQAMLAAAGADVAEIAVHRLPRVTIIGTGDELVAPGEARTHPGTIPESISFSVAALVDDWGGVVVGRRRLPDQLSIITGAVAEAMQVSDLIVVTGGASVGERDFSKAAVAVHGLETLFDKVAIKPGKPVWFGRAGEVLVLGLPGNPSSALVTARLLLAPLLAGLAGDDPRTAARWTKAPLGAPLGACGDRETFVRAKSTGPCVVALNNQDSGAQKALADSDCLIRHRAGTPSLETGDDVEVIAL